MIRLFVEAPLGSEAAVPVSPAQAHYLGGVMRAKTGEHVLLFNGRDGEWDGEIVELAKAKGVVACRHQTRPQTPEPDLWLLAAPIKRDRIDLVAEKAGELGASALWPVFTRRTQMTRVNQDRLRAHLMEAAEQCERLTVPDLMPPVPLDAALAGWPEDRILLFLDETREAPPLAEVVAALPPDAKLAVLIGPEGGFDPKERQHLLAHSFVRPAHLGPRVLRADTAAIAALAVVAAMRI